MVKEVLRVLNGHDVNVLMGKAIPFFLSLKLPFSQRVKEKHVKGHGSHLPQTIIKNVYAGLCRKPGDNTKGDNPTIIKVIDGYPNINSS